MKKIKHQENIIVKAEAIAKESAPTDLLRRAREGVEYNKRLVEDHDRVINERLRKIQEDGDRSRRDKVEALRKAEDRLDSYLSVRPRNVVSAITEIAELKKQLEDMNLPQIKTFVIEELPVAPVAPVAPTLSDEEQKKKVADYWKKQEEEELARSREMRQAAAEEEEESGPSDTNNLLDGRRLISNTKMKKPLKTVPRRP